MKIFAQHGHQPSDKLQRGLHEGLIQGVILSTRYSAPSKIEETIREARLFNPSGEILIDPEFYATRQIGTPNNQLGHLEDWEYFTAISRRDLVKSRVVREILEKVHSQFSAVEVTAHVAPNIYIPQSFDSIEAGIAINFIAQAKESFVGEKRPVLATLAVDRRALLSPPDFRSFLNDLTALDTPPDGVYLLIGGGLINERSDVVHSDVSDANVIAGWMALNFALSQNGFRVINGYSDILTCFLAAVGAEAGATGWWSNLRVFSMGRYVKPEGKGGQLPAVRYLSNLLLNRIKVDELVAYSRVIPEVLNKSSLDSQFLDDAVPTRAVEALQTWDALGSLSGEVAVDGINQNLEKLARQIDQAKAAYARLASRGLSQGNESISEYLQQLSNAIEIFKGLAEL
jgi:hypothetical protein